MYDTVKGSDWLGEKGTESCLGSIGKGTNYSLSGSSFFISQVIKMQFSICAERPQKLLLSSKIMAYLFQELKLERFISAPLEAKV